LYAPSEHNLPLDPRPLTHYPLQEEIINAA